MAQDQSFNFGQSPANKQYKKEMGSPQFEHICIVCWKRDRKLNSVNPKEEGRQKLYSSLITSSDSIFYRVKFNSGFKRYDEGKIIGFSDILVRYHRKCYQNYTDCRNLSFRLLGEDGPSKEESDEDSGVRTRTCTKPFDSSKCIFCDLVKRKVMHV